MERALRGWVCPECGRRFGRRNQSHTCAPALSLDDYFAPRPPADRRIFEAVAACLDGEAVEVEAVTVGVFFRKTRTFAELRGRREGLELSFLLSERADHPRLTRVVRASGRRFGHFVRLRRPEDVDDEICEWLIRAYVESPE